MAKKVLTNMQVLVGGNDVSAYVKQVTLRYMGEAVETTTMNAAGAKGRDAGLKDWSADIEFVNDYAAAAVDSILFPLVGTKVTFEARPDNSARSTSNPGYTGSAILTSYQAVGGSVGQPSAAPISLSGDGALARQTS